jgi:hypothetical protein
MAATIMPDEITPTPAATGGTSAVPTPTGTAPATTSAATPAAEQPYRTFANQAELDGFVKSSKSQAERAALRKMAKDLGFEDVDEMRESLQTLRQAQGGGAQAQPGATPETPTSQATSQPDAARLQMALTVGAKLNLPAALIGRLQGTTEAEMEADATALLALMGSGATQPRTPGIPPVPPGNQPVTFTQTQLQDPKFVRANAEAIRKAHAEGRIVRS